MRETHPHKFKVDYAFGDGMNIPTQMNQHGKELWELIKKNNTFVYMSGNKNMENGIDESMTALAHQNGNCPSVQYYLYIYSWDGLYQTFGAFNDMSNSNNFLTPQPISFCQLMCQKFNEETVKLTPFKYEYCNLANLYAAFAGVIWLDYKTMLRREGRWNVEVY